MQQVCQQDMRPIPSAYLKYSEKLIAYFVTGPQDHEKGIQRHSADHNDLEELAGHDFLHKRATLTIFPPGGKVRKRGVTMQQSPAGGQHQGSGSAFPSPMNTDLHTWLSSMSGALGLENLTIHPVKVPWTTLHWSKEVVMGDRSRLAGGTGDMCDYICFHLSQLQRALRMDPTFHSRILVRLFAIHIDIMYSQYKSV